MSDNDQQIDTDLLGSETSDTNADGVTSGEKADTLLTEDEQIHDPVKDKTAENTAKVQRQKQVDHWVNEIAAGTKSLDDLPTDKQWLKPGIQNQLKALEKEPEIDKMIEEKLAKKEVQLEVERHYKALRTTLRSVKPKQEQLERIQTRQDQLLARGVPKNEALEIAMEAAGISLDPEEQDRLILRQRMALPYQGNDALSDKDPSPEDPDFHKKVKDPKQKMRILMQSLRS